jgi:hypothetical protein
VKRRKACAADEPASSGEILNAFELHA